MPGMICTATLGHEVTKNKHYTHDEKEIWSQILCKVGGPLF